VLHGYDRVAANILSCGKLIIQLRYVTIRIIADDKFPFPVIRIGRSEVNSRQFLFLIIRKIITIIECSIKRYICRYRRCSNAR